MTPPVVFPGTSCGIAEATVIVLAPIASPPTASCSSLSILPPAPSSLKIETLSCRLEVAAPPSRFVTSNDIEAGTCLAPPSTGVNINVF